MKAKLYSNFVKSGTLTGGKMEEAQETDSGFVEDKVNLNWRLLFFVEGCHCIILECSNPLCLKQCDIELQDLSLLRTLTDEELVKACGGRTAHK